MKRLLSLLTAYFLVILFISLTACSNGGMKKTSNIWYFGDIESKDPLRICMDIQQTQKLDSKKDYEEVEEAMEELLDNLRVNLGIQNIVIEFIPNKMNSNGSFESREPTVRRMRLEMLAGKGPDVFIMRYMPPAGGQGFDVNSGDTLIKSPQKVMESDLFLPLDEYIENNTQYTEWEKFPKVIMDAGRNAEGQQIIPITYTFPVIIYSKEVFDFTPNCALSFDDLLSDSLLAPYSKDLINCDHYGGYPGYFEFTFGQLVDYEEEELLFTEEELLLYVKKILAADSNDTHQSEEEGWISASIRSYSEPVTVIPWYSRDGGITARIEAYAAVSRSTDRPDEAFAVIDTLMSTQAQQNYKIYSKYFCDDYLGGLLMNEEEEKHDIGERIYQNAENYRTICELQEQITHVNFACDVGTLVSGLVTDGKNFPETIEERVHEVYEDLQRRIKE